MINTIRSMARGLVYHEMGHWEVCLFDSDGKYLLTELYR